MCTSTAGHVAAGWMLMTTGVALEHERLSEAEALLSLLYSRIHGTVISF